jgi:hypothetical protein
VDERLSGIADVWTEERVKERKVGKTGVRKSGRTNGWKEGQVNRRMGERSDDFMDGSV